VIEKHPLAKPLIIVRPGPGSERNEGTPEVVEAEAFLLPPPVQLSRCKCGFVGETRDPRVLEAVRAGIDFRVPCKCGRTRQIRGKRIISVANRGLHKGRG
jgi:hypothetical protein